MLFQSGVRKTNILPLSQAGQPGRCPYITLWSQTVTFLSEQSPGLAADKAALSPEGDCVREKTGKWIKECSNKAAFKVMFSRM